MHDFIEKGSFRPPLKIEGLASHLLRYIFLISHPHFEVDFNKHLWIQINKSKHREDPTAAK
jgi:hypothetical protein